MATLPNPHRRRVVWIGKRIPKRLAQELSQWQLEASPGDLDTIKRREREIRSILVPYSANANLLRKTFAHLRGSANTGALIVLVIRSEEDRSEATRLASDEPVVIRNRSIVADVARECGYHDPGRWANRDLVIDGPAQDVIEETKTLFQRAFEDFARLESEELAGGRSRAAGVWKVEAYDQTGRCCEPFVVKAGAYKLIDEEIATMVGRVVDYVPFPHCPPIVESRCVKGTTLRLMVSRFVDQATRLDEYLLFDSPRVAIDALFVGPLRTWRANRTPAEVQLAEEYARFGVIPKVERVGQLDEAFHTAQQNNGELLTPAQLLQRLAGMPRIAVSACASHGDLHTRNIFVRRNSTDVILIDFARGQQPGPSSRDLANLDVAIAFDVPDRSGNYLSIDTLRSLYAPPLLPARHELHADSRADAVQQVRLHAAGEGITSREYEISVACYLLRFARLVTAADVDNVVHVNRLAGLAYELAQNLVVSHTEG